MSGIVNSTGAKSGVIGTMTAPAVGTGTDGYVLTATGAGVDPAWEVAPSSDAGKAYFVASMGSNTGWHELSSNAVVPFNSEEIDDDSCTSDTGGTIRFTAPATGWYLFGMEIYTSENDGSATFNFYVDGSNTTFTSSTHYGFGDVDNGGTFDRMENGTAVLKLNATQYVTVNAVIAGDAYGGHSVFWGCRIR